MSCISVNITRIGEGIKASVASAKGLLSPKVSLLNNSLIAKVTDIASRLKVNISRIDNALSVRCSVVCSITELKEYLNVTPSEVQWITDDIGVFFEVESNVQWIVTTE